MISYTFVFEPGVPNTMHFQSALAHGFSINEIPYLISYQKICLNMGATISTYKDDMIIENNYGFIFF